MHRGKMAKYALVVGISQYDNFSDLPTAAGDAEAVARLLEQHDHKVTRLPREQVHEKVWAITPDQSLSHTELSAELKAFLSGRAEYDNALLYFVGRSFQVEDSLTGEADTYLATSQATPTGQNAISITSLTRLISQVELDSLLVLMDCCCRDVSTDVQPQLLQPLQTLIRRKSKFCLLATCHDDASNAPNAKEGAFTTAVLKGCSADQAVQSSVTSRTLSRFVAQTLGGIQQTVIQAGEEEEIAIAHYPLHREAAKKGTPPSANIFISYRSQPPDSTLATTLYKALRADGHSVFMAAESIRLGENWSQRIDRELANSDYFLLLLSAQSATSEMVTEEVRRAKELRDTRRAGRPKILPVRVRFPLSAALNYNLGGYLNRIQQREWWSVEDTPQLLQEILSILAGEASSHSASESADEPAEGPESSESFSEDLNEPPAPVAPPELPGGQVDLASLYYVARPPTEFKCYETISQPGALIRIKAPRQMGKTSLLSRVLRHAENERCLTVPLSFQLANAAIFSDLDKFLQWFCAIVGRRLKLPSRLHDYWDGIFGSKDNCTAYFEEYLLPSLSSPLVLGLDEVDMVFKHPNIAADFMGLLRAWHEAGKVSALWKRLRLVIVHSTEVYIPMNINQSPFNVGLPIELLEFSAEQILDLARRHGLDWSLSEVEQLMQMVGGHPYLVRVALYQVARREITLTELLEIAPTESGPYGDHLRRHWWNLEQRAEMAEAAKRVVTANGAVLLEPIQAFQLHSMGIVHLRGNDVLPRCDLYKTYFSNRLTVGRG